MFRIDDLTLYNPFGWRLADLADPSLGTARRRELSEELLVWEAAEIAHGYRHLTVVHGPAVTVAESGDLDAFYDTIRSVAAAVGWARVRGATDYVTVTVRGLAADETIDGLVAAARSASQGRWEITVSAYPTCAD